MKEFILPEKWAVLITKENKIILNDYLQKNKERYPCFTNKWKVETLSSQGENLWFCNFPAFSGAHSSLEVGEGFTEITFDEFKQYVLKQKPEKMKKQDFTIEGSVALKKAFIEECGVGMHEGYFDFYSLDSYTFLKNSDEYKKFLAGTEVERNLHFNLNTQYGEALEYVKEYFKPEEPEFKVGDLVVVLSDDYFYENSEKGNVQKITKITDFLEAPYWVSFKDGSENCYKKIRHATPEEIEDYNNHKLPKINGYEGKLVDKMIVYGNDCAKLPTKWFKDTFGATRHIKSMVLSSGVSINEEQMNQIRKAINTKTK